MKVLFITRSLTNGGAAVAINRYLEAISASERLEIITCTEFRRSEFFRRIFYFIYKSLNLLVTRNNLFGITVTLNMFSTITKRINFANYDLVHLNWVGLDFLTLKKISEMPSRIIWTIHDEQLIDGILHFPRAGNLLCSSLLRNRHHDQMMKLVGQANITFVFPSKSLKMKFQKKYTFATTLHIPNPVSISVKPIRPSRERFSMSTLAVGGFSILSDERKGFDLLKSAFLSSDVLANYTLDIFGEDSSDINLPKNFRTHGLLNQIDVQKLIDSAKFVVVPSREENFPSIILEAMSLGVPVIATRTGGIPEIIEHGVNGFLCEPNAQSLSNCLKLATSTTKSEYIKLSSAAQKFVNSEYSYDAIMNRYIEAYSK